LLAEPGNDTHGELRAGALDSHRVGNGAVVVPGEGVKAVGVWDQREGDLTAEEAFSPENSTPETKVAMGFCLPKR
jgi:hypothetical protein